MIEDDEPTGKAKGGHARADSLPAERRSEIAKQAAEARWKAEPLSLIEDVETGDRFALFTNGDGSNFQIQFDGSEPWATRKQMADLFGRDMSRITRHIKAIFDDGELDRESNVRKTHIASSDKPVEIYSLDAVLSVGYRVKSSNQAVMFRRWANGILRQYLLNGFVIDVPRLEDPDGRPDHFAELLAKVRHIRTSEKRMWTRVLELATFCSDYGMMTDDDRSNFFATIQNAMHWSVAQMTEAEVIYERVDASKENCGVVTFKGELPTAEEAKVAKNLYYPADLETLNLVTNLTLEFFESQAEQRRPTTIAQFLDKMRDLLKLDGRPLIRKGNLGEVSMTAAKAKASAEMKAFKDRVKLEREIAGERALRQIGEKIQKRPKRPRK